ncbi:ubiquinol oxidase subunit II [uncultured Sphingomonas sp.]|uniref:ubiquinol oxidase subunit II n=1 Tax=uncultured Sphingomonas sp. TaxID=158754 RepID=UPI0035CBF20B
MRRAFTLLLPLLLAGCEPGVLNPAGPVAAGDRTILLNALAIMLAIIVPVIVLTIVFAWWFRAGNTRARYRPDWSYSGELELLVWSIPLLAVIFLAGIGWVGSHQLDPGRPLPSRQPPVRVQVVALDWKWLFIYPDQGVATINHLVIPAGRPVALRITSATVMNSFFVPRLGSQIYAMSGMDAGLNLQADRIGRYRGLSAHYSGAGFADMTFAVDAVPPAAFARWVAGSRQAPARLDGALYSRLAAQEATMRPATFGAVAPGLYDAVVRQSGTGTHQTLKHSGRVE